MRVAPSSERNSITVNYDGLMDNRIRTVVLTAGTLGSRRHINLPGVHVNLPALTEKDLADVALGVELGVDFVALSFARKKEDLEELRQVLQKSGSTAQVVASGSNVRWKSCRSFNAGSSNVVSGWANRSSSVDPMIVLRAE